MLYELRQYTCTAGNREAFIKVMEEDIIPFQVSQGMVILASFAGEEDENTYVWMRRFKDEDERLKLYDAVYKSDHWNKVIAPKIGNMLDRTGIKVTRLTPTAKSPLQ